MGRILKRVPLDFDWPIGEVWEGYINPYRDKNKDCHYCERTGYNPTALVYHKQWYGYTYFNPEMTGSEPYNPYDDFILDMIKNRVDRDKERDFYTNKGMISLYDAILNEAQRMCDIWNSAWQYHLNQDDVNGLVDAGRLKDFTHTFISGQGWIKRDPEIIPTAKEVNLWALSGFGHDSLNEYQCIKNRCLKEGIDTTCQYCNGEGVLWDNPEDKIKYEEWKEIELPKGEGYQLWENTTEGSPKSPVFDTLDDLCQWCETNATTFADNKVTAKEWKEMLDNGQVYHQEGNFIFI